MPRFTDAQQREWELVIDAPAVLRVREEVDPKFLLNDDEKENTYTRLANDTVMLCRVIYELCSDQRKERNLSEKDFYLGVIGDAIDDATEALLQAILGFTPRRTREMLALYAEKANKIQDRVHSRMMAKLNDQGIEDRIVAIAEQKVDQAIEKTMTQFGSATSTPAS